MTVCGIDRRDHDFGKETKNEEHSKFPYTFPDQLVISAYLALGLQCLELPLHLDLARDGTA